MRLGNYLSSLTAPKLEHIILQLNLSDDEEQIFYLLSKKKSIQEIADRLGMSTRSVDREIARIRAKLADDMN